MRYACVLVCIDRGGWRVARGRPHLRQCGAGRGGHTSAPREAPAATDATRRPSIALPLAARRPRSLALLPPSSSIHFGHIDPRTTLGDVCSSFVDVVRLCYSTMPTHTK